MKNIQLSYLLEKKSIQYLFKQKDKNEKNYFRLRKNLYENYLKLPFRV